MHQFLMRRNIAFMISSTWWKVYWHNRFRIVFFYLSLQIYRITFILFIFIVILSL